jgi:hypothetical protein
MSTRTMKMLGVGIAAIAFLLVTIPVLKSSVARFAMQVCKIREKRSPK